MILEIFNHQRIASILYHLNNGVIKRVFVLLKPSSKIVRHCSCIMDYSKMGIRIWPFGRFGKVGPLSYQAGMKLLSKGFISSFLEKRFLFKD